MLPELCQIVTLKKLFQTARFAVFADGCYRQLYDNGTYSDICNDFADIYITLRVKGWKNG